MATNVNREANLRGGYGAAAGRPQPPAKFSWYPASLVGILDGPFRGRELSLVPGQTSPASADAPRPRKPSATCFEPSEASETFSGVFWSFPTRRKRSAACFGAFRGLGNVQRRVLMLSEASEMFSGVFWSFPRPRGGCGRQRSFSGTRQAWPASLTPRKGGKHAPQGVPRPSRLSLPPVIWYRDALRAIRYHV